MSSLKPHIEKLRESIHKLKAEKSKIIGLDISSGSIKLMELYSDGGMSYEVASFTMYPLPEGLITSDHFNDEDVLSTHLKRAITQSGVSSKEIAVGLPGSLVMVKTITIPATTEFALVKQIRYEADSSIPYDIDDVYLDFMIKGSNEEDPAMIDVTIIVAKRENVEMYRRVVEGAGLILKCVDANVFAIENVAEAMLEEDPAHAGAQAFIDIGRDSISMSVVHDGQHTFNKEISFGMSYLIKQIMDVMNVNEHGANKIIIDGFANEIDEAILDDFFNAAASEIRNMVDVYTGSGFMDSPISKAHISGGFACVDKFVERLDVAADLFNMAPLNVSRSLVSTSSDSQSYIDKNAPMLTVATGLALRRFDK